MAFGYLNNTLLDGMPCDNVDEMIGQTTPSHGRNMDIHAQHWANERMNSTTYSGAEIVKGMFEPAGLTYESLRKGLTRLERSSRGYKGYTRLECSYK